MKLLSVLLILHFQMQQRLFVQALNLKESGFLPVDCYDWSDDLIYADFIKDKAFSPSECPVKCKNYNFFLLDTKSCICANGIKAGIKPNNGAKCKPCNIPKQYLYSDEFNCGVEGTDMLYIKETYAETIIGFTQSIWFKLGCYTLKSDLILEPKEALTYSASECSTLCDKPIMVLSDGECICATGINKKYTVNDGSTCTMCANSAQSFLSDTYICGIKDEAVMIYGRKVNGNWKGLLPELWNGRLLDSEDESECECGLFDESSPVMAGVMTCPRNPTNKNSSCNAVVNEPDDDRNIPIQQRTYTGWEVIIYARKDPNTDPSKPLRFSMAVDFEENSIDFRFL